MDGAGVPGAPPVTLEQEIMWLIGGFLEEQGHKELADS